MIYNLSYIKARDGPMGRLAQGGLCGYQSADMSKIGNPLQVYPVLMCWIRPYIHFMYPFAFGAIPPDPMYLLSRSKMYIA